MRTANSRRSTNGTTHKISRAMRSACLDAEWVIPTEAEAAVWEALDGLRREFDRPPKIREVAESTGLSIGGVSYLLKGLTQKDYLRRREGAPCGVVMRKGIKIAGNVGDRGEVTWR